MKVLEKLKLKIPAGSKSEKIVFKHVVTKLGEAAVLAG